MSPEERDRVGKQLREALRRARGHAGFFEWPLNRDQEEVGVLVSLFGSMEKDGTLAYGSLKSRGRGNDPPDCEATNLRGERVAIEVTELVNGTSISAARKGEIHLADAWPRQVFLERLHKLLLAKNARYPKLKGSPYPGGYVVVVFTDEPFLTYETIEEYLRGHIFASLRQITRALLLLSYDPVRDECPYFELAVDV